MTRTRSEYRLSPVRVDAVPDELRTIHPVEAHRRALATLMLDAYRGTIDDEGEDLDDAGAAIDHYFGSILRPYSFVLLEGDRPVAFSFVLVVDDVHYIDPVVVASTRKRKGLGRAVVRCSLASLSEAGIAEVGATITDGNTASERLFAGLGFTRHGAWS